MSARIWWLLRRLRAMSPSEVAQRVVRTARLAVWRPRTIRARFDVTERPPHPRPRELLGSPLAAGLLAEADAILAGTYQLLNLTIRERPLDWHLDPESGTQSPDRPARRIDYWDRHTVGNVRNIWEKSRHHHLTQVGLAYALTGEERYARTVADELRSWTEHNPVGHGVNWTSELELGIRLVSWVWIDRLLQGAEAHDEIFGPSGFLWPSAYWHQEWISRFHSLGSSANNHLIGEMAGLFLAASAWPFFPQARRWQAQAQGVLEREVDRQTFRSGLNRELAFGYHLFALQFFTLAGIEGDRAGMRFSRGYREWVEAMGQVVDALTDVGGNLPRFGDDDDGLALQLLPTLADRRGWSRDLALTWAAGLDPNSEEGRFVAQVVLPEPHRTERTPSQSARPRSCCEDAGFYVLASARGRSDEVFCLADAGPLGFLSIAAHGHADALSFSMNAAGVPLVTDIGTATYYADPARRAYFRSTQGHNTITLDGLDQSTPGGTFLWTTKARTKVLSFDDGPDGAKLVAEHDGYLRRQGVTHARTLHLDRQRLLVVDELRGEGSHKVEWRLHFAPECIVQLDDDRCRVERLPVQLTIRLAPELRWRLARQEPEGGWYSPAFNACVPSTTLIGAGSGPVPIKLTNVLEVTFER